MNKIKISRSSNRKSEGMSISVAEFSRAFDVPRSEFLLCRNLMLRISGMNFTPHVSRKVKSKNPNLLGTGNSIFFGIEEAEILKEAGIEPLVGMPQMIEAEFVGFRDDKMLSPINVNTKLNKRDSGIVYLLWDSIFDEYKIGYTKRTVRERIKEIQNESGSRFGNQIQIVRQVELVKPKLFESLIHKLFETKRVSGTREWFKLTIDDHSFLRIIFAQLRKYNQDPERLNELLVQLLFAQDYNRNLV